MKIWVLAVWFSLLSTALYSQVLYEVNFSAFSPTKDLAGVTAKLQELQDLGVDTVWLMPIHPVGVLKAFGSPYSVRDYGSVNPRLGTVEDLRVLVNRAHDLGLKVILDWVANHTSWDHPWTKNPSWYTRNSQGVILHPPGTDWTDVADLNFDSREMRQAMTTAMAWWVTEIGVDGFRCDAADMIPADFWKEAISHLRALTNKELFFLAEGNRPDHFDSGFQAVFVWDFYTTLKTVFAHKLSMNRAWDTLKTETARFPAGSRLLRFITNHDESNQATPVQVFGSPKAALAASVITYLLPGIPLLYNGQEVGAASPQVYLGGSSIRWSGNPGLPAAYGALFNLYRSSPAVRAGTLVSYPHPDVAAFQRIYEDQGLLVLVNTRSSERLFETPETLKGTWKDALTGEGLILSNPLPLEGYGYRILQRN